MFLFATDDILILIFMTHALVFPVWHVLGMMIDLHSIFNTFQIITGIISLLAGALWFP